MPSLLANGAIISKAANKHRELVSRQQEAAEDASILEDRLLGIEDAIKEVGALAITCQTTCQQKISSIVNKCLVEIDPDTKYTFKLVFEEKRNQTEARCVLVDGAGNETSMNSVGGGIRNIVAFGLRLACLMLYRPAPSKVLILDEPFQWLSKEYRVPMLRLLQSLCTELGVQIIMVTHVQEHIASNANIIEIE
jgi:DNA repair exonuclease SbcCD ATPase subunit